MSDQTVKMIKEEDLVLPSSDDEDGVAIITSEVMEDLQQLDKMKPDNFLKQETPKRSWQANSKFN